MYTERGKAHWLFTAGAGHASHKWCRSLFTLLQHPRYGTRVIVNEAAQFFEMARGPTASNAGYRWMRLARP